ncbi:MAG: cyclopropane-fatty-acyl-phospholipid synthase family protein [Fuerstiella sp.]
MSEQSSDQRLLNDQFPRSSRYHPDWVIQNAMGSQVLWLTEWLAEEMHFEPGQRVLDLGCGRGLSSIFLAREYDVQVWAVDLWIGAHENSKRIADAGLADRIFPLHSDARSLPFAAEFFEAIVSIDSFSYYGTDGLYLNYLAQFVKASGRIGIAGAGLANEIDSIPPHLSGFWTEDFWCLHSADWWKRHWDRTGIVDVRISDDMPNAASNWLDWQQTAHPDNTSEIEALKADDGQLLTYTRTIAERRPDAGLVDYCWPDNLKSFPDGYVWQPLLRGESGSGSE